jgi:hypothetical protein
MSGGDTKLGIRSDEALNASSLQFLCQRKNNAKESRGKTKDKLEIKVNRVK